ncbi:MAG: hypothetical protein E6K76_07870 [Candidatus Eisenbacteria bacterium]|uniref:HMA domain-containing protein n=1 Tax=Eiseniibacteriota bacterium TaxID=2212470 RepID=A0A538T462_UNCEI|nr:MAG: hypothetical protein E6K76_07870 [Candidatus Eisenbacteria bacterium]
MIRARFRSSILIGAIAALVFTAHASAGGSRATEPPVPFARIYLALRGCTSCSHCRATIRQMARAGSGGGEARVSTEAVEVRYPKPRPVPLRDVIRRLAENRLHDLTLVDVLFEAEGTIARTSAGSTTFTLRDTGQSFPLDMTPSLARPDRGTPVRLIAIVEGWRGKGALTLVAREARGIT